MYGVINGIEICNLFRNEELNISNIIQYSG